MVGEVWHRGIRSESDGVCDCSCESAIVSVEGLLDLTGSILVLHRCGRRRGVLNGQNIVIGMTFSSF